MGNKIERNKNYFWHEDEKEYIKQIAKGRLYRDIAKLMAEKFNYRTYTEYSVCSVLGRMRISTGIDCSFKKGHVPHNKGKKGKANSGSFKKGHSSPRKLPIGSEKEGQYGYTVIKVANPSVWVAKHRFMYELYNGKIPKGGNVIFADGNKENFEKDNLLLVTSTEMLGLNQERLRFNNAELTKVGLNIVKLNNAIKEKENGNDEKI